jgi:dynein heavy chain
MASPVTVCRLWRTEALRVFHDRLISKEDKDWFIKTANEQLKKSFAGQADAALEGPVLFGDFRNALAIIDGGFEARINEDFGGYGDVKTIFELLLASYNEKNKAMNLVLFDDAIEHLLRLHRLLRLPRGNALLVGVGGSGKQSLTRLAAFAAQCVIFQVKNTYIYIYFILGISVYFSYVYHYQ